MIEADNLKYDKNRNILTFINSVRFHDKIKKLIIESDKIIYEEDKGLIFSEGKSKLNSMSHPRHAKTWRAGPGP